MPIHTAVRTARLLSVHSEPSTLRLEIPSVTPGTYFIPGIDADPGEFEKCVFSFRGRPPVQYAVLKEIDGNKYVEVEVFEGKTPQYGTELTQKLDEYGFVMNPPLTRALLIVTAEDIANELERQSVFFDQNLGIHAVSDEITFKEIAAAQLDNLKYMQRNVAETSRWSKHGSMNITEQARSHAWKLHKMGKLNPLPEWATVNPDGGAAFDTFNCINCGVVLRKSIIKCPTSGCGVIYDWKAAVETGIIPARDVPKSKRVEAGLENEPTKGEVLQAVRDKVAADFKEGRV